MADQRDVRRIALALPEAEEDDDHFAFSVPAGAKRKGFAWVWKERVEPKKPRVPNPDVLAVRVANEAEKQMLIAAQPGDVLHRAALQRVPRGVGAAGAIELDELEELLIDGWRCQAPRALVKAWDEAHPAADA